MVDNAEGDSNDNPDDPIVTFDFAELGGVIELRPSQALDWIKKDIEGWGWFSEVKDPHAQTAVEQIRTRIKGTSRKAVASINAYLTTKDKTTLNAMVSGVQDAYKSVRLPIQQSPTAKFIQDLAVKNRGMAASAFAYLLNTHWPLSNTDATEGMLLAFAFAHGIQARTEQEHAAVNELLDKAGKKVAEFSISGNEALSQFAADTTVQKELFGEVSATAKQKVEEFSSAAADAIGSAKADFEVLVETLNAKLTLQAPVTYWSTKRHEHKRAARWAGWKMWVWLIGGLVAIAFAASHLLAAEAKNAISLPIWHFALFTTLIAMYIWIARILVRTMMSQQHLEADAHERIVVANTFLALIRKGRVSEQAVLPELLKALLRHSPDGIVNDDAMPLISDMLRGKSIGS